MKTISRLVILVILICLTQIALTQHKSTNDLKREELLGAIHTIKTVKIPVSPAGVELKNYGSLGIRVVRPISCGSEAEQTIAFQIKA